MAPVLRAHPTLPHEIASMLDGTDALTVSLRQHRLLAPRAGGDSILLDFTRRALEQHHASNEMRQRRARTNAALLRQGLQAQDLYPNSLNTQKGNLGEVLLAAYLTATEDMELPVYRLHYNPNVDQSMKGNDVLAFDLDASPPRLLVGEAKFRTAPRRQDVVAIVNSLLASYQAKIPSSLQFVADRLYEQGRDDLAQRVEDCHVAILTGQIGLGYVGFLVGSTSTANCVAMHTPGGQPRHLAVISLSLANPADFVANAFRDLR